MMTDGPISYPLLYLMCVCAGTVVPIPEDVLVAWTGSRLAVGEGEWAPTFAVVFAGVLSRDGLFYGLGRVLGARALVPEGFVARRIGPDRIVRVRERLERNGPIAVLVGRLSVGVRAASFLVAGSLGLRARDFLVWDVIGLCVTTPLLLGLGYAFGEPIQHGIAWLTERMTIAVPFGVALAVAWWAWEARKKGA